MESGTEPLLGFVQITKAGGIKLQAVRLRG
jgi:hypothetical protein